MTEIDYYLLGNNSLAVRELFAIKLTEKAFRNRLSVFLHTENQEQTERLDELLWSYRKNSFLPHDLQKHSDEQTAIVIANGENPKHHYQVLINLSSQRPSFFSQFERMLELVIDEEPIKTNSRENYKFFNTRGYKLNVHHCESQAETLSLAFNAA